MTSRPLWFPGAARVAQSNLRRFTGAINPRLETYAEIHRFSVNEPEAFWSAVWDFCAVKAEARGSQILIDGDKMPGARFFPDARLNYAENMLR
ncbi:MAG TPA: acetyl-coenzyme A synthetase N-terminal domain-containing protein, partial [Aestuariivirga sp.]|nr:acetyl-coenzyme A synthetase N-terminal domain-containing protein [Aestuariivirga sp.]